MTFLWIHNRKWEGARCISTLLLLEYMCCLVQQIGICQYYNCLISLAITATSFAFVSIIMVSNVWYIDILAMLRSIISSERIPLSTSIANLSHRVFSFATSETHFTAQFCVSSFSSMELIILCSCITQQKMIFSYAEHFRKLLST